MAYTKTLNTGLPECRNTKTRNTTLLKPGKHGKKLIKFKQENSPSMPTPGGVPPEKLGRSVRLASQNPYPIYDQNLRFSLPYL